MNFLDIIIVIVLAISFFFGLGTGLVRGIFSLLGIIVGLVLARQFYTAFSDSMATQVLTFIIISAVVTGVISLLGSIVKKVLHVMMLGWLDHLGGALLGVVIGGTLIALALLAYLHFFGPNSTITSSVVSRLLMDKLSWVLGLLPGKFAEPLKSFFY